MDPQRVVELEEQLPDSTNFIKDSTDRPMVGITNLKYSTEVKSTSESTSTRTVMSESTSTRTVVYKVQDLSTIKPGLAEEVHGDQSTPGATAGDGRLQKWEGGLYKEHVTSSDRKKFDAKEVKERWKDLDLKQAPTPKSKSKLKRVLKAKHSQGLESLNTRAIKLGLITSHFKQVGHPETNCS